MMLTCPIKKSETKEQIVWAEVYAPNIPDSDGDFMDAETIKKMAYQFMKDLNLRNIDVQHDNVLVNNTCVIESFIARKGDETFLEGSWVVGVHIGDADTWEKVEKQEINGFSLEALVSKTVVLVEMDIPPIIRGMTSKSEEHEHTFYVAYNKDGDFMGGKTDVVNGHYHEIRRGTITEKSADHEHRFSFVEGISVEEM